MPIANRLRFRDENGDCTPAKIARDLEEPDWAGGFKTTLDVQLPSCGACAINLQVGNNRVIASPGDSSIYCHVLREFAVLERSCLVAGSVHHTLERTCSKTDSIAAPDCCALKGIERGFDSYGNHFPLWHINFVLSRRVDFSRASVPREQRKASQGRPDNFSSPRATGVAYFESFNEVRSNACCALVRFDRLVHATLHNQQRALREQCSCRDCQFSGQNWIDVAVECQCRHFGICRTGGDDRRGRARLFPKNAVPTIPNDVKACGCRLRKGCKVIRRKSRNSLCRLIEAQLGRRGPLKRHGIVHTPCRPICPCRNKCRIAKIRHHRSKALRSESKERQIVSTPQRISCCQKFTGIEITEIRASRNLGQHAFIEVHVHRISVRIVSNALHGFVSDPPD